MSIITEEMRYRQNYVNLLKNTELQKPQGDIILTVSLCIDN